MVKERQNLNPTLSVTEFIALVNQTLEFAYPRVTVEGEVSSLKVWRERFVYFDIKDEESTLNCFMSVYQMKTPLEDGMKVRVTATPKLTAKGRFSVTVHSYELAGEGALKRAYELLKAKLDKEGLFAAERKRALPRFPRRIGLITSLQSAAYKDFMEILSQRWRGLTVTALDVQVQGAAAVEQIGAALEYCNELAQPFDVVVLIRGGGSLEDLQAFNTEPVARAVAASRTPIVVGVGHEVDVSLADLAADARAATPTDAAKQVAPDQAEILAQIGYLRKSLADNISRSLEQQSNSVSHSVRAIVQFVPSLSQRVNQLNDRIARAVEQKLELFNQQVAATRRTLKGVDPKRLLRQGYAIARKGRRIIRSAADVVVGDAVVLELAKDRLTTEVKDAESS